MQPEADVPPSLLHLPIDVFGLIVEYSKSADYWERWHSLLPVCRVGRDAVLQRIKSVDLDARRGELKRAAPNTAACARFLDRACTTAAAGLRASLYITSEKGTLATLLQPGLDRNGWSNVHALTVNSAGEQLTLIPPAFPAIQSLELDNTDLGDGDLFTHLPSLPLHTLILTRCEIESSAVQSSAAALANITGLMSVTTDTWLPLNLFDQLTGLTTLRVDKMDTRATPVFKAAVMALATRSPQLRELAMTKHHRNRLLGSDELKHLLTSCSHLTNLKLKGFYIDCQGLEHIFVHGTNITSLVCDDMGLGESSYVHRAWNIRQLIIKHLSVEHMAALPLQHVQRISTIESVYVTELKLRTYMSTGQPPAEVADLLHEAATNLAASAALKPETHIELCGYVYPDPDDQIGLLLLRALTPFGSPGRVTSLTLRLRNLDLHLGSAEVQALGQAFGSSLKVLELKRCTLEESFWAEVAGALPLLEKITLCQEVFYQAADVVAFGTSSGPRRITVEVSKRAAQNLATTYPISSMEHVTFSEWSTLCYDTEWSCNSEWLTE